MQRPSMCQHPRTAGLVDPEVCERLFVYGTLRRGFPLHHHLVSLGARFLGQAKVAAELYDLGSDYPGARATETPDQWVRGELYRLRKPAHDLIVLDRVEDYTPGGPKCSEFVRARAEVILKNGSSSGAWIYWLAHPAKFAHRIASGDYAAARP